MTLSDIEAKSYWGEGLLFPQRAISEGEAGTCLVELEFYETKTGGLVTGHPRAGWLEVYRENWDLL